MFDAVARRYDITNTVLSMGQDRSWRRANRSALRIGPGDAVLDLAAGTAVSTVELATSGAWCVACDFSVGHAQGRRAARRAQGGRRRDQAAVRRRRVRRGDHQLRAAQRRRHRGRAAGDGPGDQARWPVGGLRVLHADGAAVLHGLQGIPDARTAGDGPRGVQRTRSPTSTWPSRSARGPIRRRWPTASARPGGRRCGGATCRAASSPCTPRSSPSPALAIRRYRVGCAPTRGEAASQGPQGADRTRVGRRVQRAGLSRGGHGRYRRGGRHLGDRAVPAFVEQVPTLPRRRGGARPAAGGLHRLR